MTNEETILQNTEEILRILKHEENATTTEPSTEFNNDIQEKINQGIPYDELKAYIIEQLTLKGIYSEANIIIKIFTHKEGDIILEIKTRPHRYMGKVVDFFYENMGEPTYFETSRYTMRLVMWYKLTKNIQMEEQTSDTNIVDDVNEQWGDNDNIDFGNWKINENNH